MEALNLDKQLRRTMQDRVSVVFDSFLEGLCRAANDYSALESIDITVWQHSDKAIWLINRTNTSYAMMWINPKGDLYAKTYDETTKDWKEHKLYG